MTTVSFLVVTRVIKYSTECRRTAGQWVSRLAVLTPDCDGSTWKHGFRAKRDASLRCPPGHSNSRRDNPEHLGLFTAQRSGRRRSRRWKTTYHSERQESQTRMVPDKLRDFQQALSLTVHVFFLQYIYIWLVAVAILYTAFSLANGLGNSI